MLVPAMPASSWRPYEAAGDPRALEEYVRAADLRVDDVELQLKAGNLLMVVGRFTDAQSRADVVLDKDDNNIAAHILRGNALGGLNNLDDALDEMEEAIDSTGTVAQVTPSWPWSSSRAENRPRLKAAFVRATELAPADVGARLALANFYWASNRLSEADKTLRAAIQADPSHQGANRAMAGFSLSTGRIAEAEPYLKRLAIDSQEPGPRFALADYYIGGRTTDAVALLETHDRHLANLGGRSRAAGPRLRGGRGSREGACHGRRSVAREPERHAVAVAQEPSAAGRRPS